jgi:hypothetical protein
VAAFFALAAAMLGISPGRALAAGPTCNVQYSIQSDWQQAFQANVTITNLGPPISGWTLSWTFPGGQKITQIWNVTPPTPAVQSGAVVTAQNANFNGSLATNGTANFGFIASETPNGTNPNPTSFTLNGQSCNHPAPLVAITSPATGASFSAPATIGLTATAAAAGGATITQVSFFDGTALIGTATSSPFSFTWQNVAAGDHNVTAVATDSTGATGTSPPLGIHVASAPSVLVTASTLSIQVGGTATFGVSLSSAPSANTTVTVAKGSGDAGITVSGGASLTFTPANFATAQTVTVAAASTTAANGAAAITASATGFVSATVNVTATPPLALHDQRFLQLYQEIKNPQNGYFSPLGIPFHSVETLIVEAPDYGHETTSEAFSFWLWLETSFGRVTGNWTPFNSAWATLEKYIIPSHADQPTNNFYNPSSPATYAPELPQPSNFPAPLDSSVKAGQDPLAGELQSTYGTQDIYGMHWMLDVQNKYGYGHCGDGTTSPAFINTFQRGPQESVWETVPQPSCETLTFGAGANGGYLPLFITGSTPAQQWRYTDAPDADARAVEAAYWALQYATAQGNASAVSATVAKAAKMGDYLRYALFDKYFKQIGNCVGPVACAPGTGKNSADYLLGWYYAWGGCLPQGSGCSWAWRIGDGVAHFGYQNPLAAFAMSNVPALTPQSPTAKSDWATSLTRQLQFYQWLQSNEGAIAGGAANSWGGAYGTPPAGDTSFFGMAYDSQPVYHDPPSNQWFGWQAWSMERVAEYYFVTGDPIAKGLLDKWVAWASANTTISSTGFTIPNTLSWSGLPNTFTGTGTPSANTNLHVTIVDTSSDVGVAAAYAKTLSYYAKKSGNTAAQTLAQQLLDSMWTNFSDPIGISSPETRTDYNRFNQAFNTTTQQGLFIPSTFTGKMPNGDPINSSSTFLSIRSWYQQDPNFAKVQAYLNGGAAPSFKYHRFWAESDIAIANDVFAQLFNG